MTEQQEHLKKAIENQKELIMEVNEMNNQIHMKKESIIKYQGIIEYLTGNGVTLPEATLPETLEIKEEEINQ